MKILMFSVYDSKASAYMQPIFMQSLGTAIRAFEDTMEDPNHQFKKHPEDFTLFHIGSFDDEGCTFDLLPTPSPIAKAIEFAHAKPPFENEVVNLKD